MPRISFLLFLFCLLLTLISPLAVTYYKSSSVTNQRASYTFRWLSAGSKISITIRPLNTLPTYMVLLWRPQQSHHKDQPFQSTQLTGSAQYISDPLDTSGYWRVQILPLSTTDKPFIFSAVVRIDGSQIQKYVDIARYNRVLPFFSAKRTPELWQVMLPTTGATLRLFGPYSQIKMEGGTPAATRNGSQIFFTTNQKSFYYLQLILSEAVMKRQQYVRITYQTDPYLCPFTQGFTDINRGFPGCQHIIPKAGYPCLFFDQVVKKCTSCYSGWRTSQIGVCVHDTNCQPNQYYSFGSCFDVIANCKDFNHFGGQCYGCNQGYELKDGNGGQQCNKISTQCGQNKYKKGQQCLEKVQNCAQFDTAKGICNTCMIGFNIQDNKCIQRPKDNSQSCTRGYSYRQGACRFNDPYCIFQTQGNCQLCAKGYRLTNQLCEKIKCTARQFSGTGVCRDVSPFCDTFDQVFGNCLTCIQSYILRSDSTCMQILFGTSTSSLSVEVEKQSPCPDRFYLKAGSCLQVSKQCLQYDTTTGVCTSCKQPSRFFLNNVGACLQKTSFCGYRQYFTQGGCKTVSIYCGDYDPNTGSCLTCRDNTRLSQGRCLVDIKCKQQQYPSPQGYCLPIDQNCLDFDKESGKCSKCKEEFQENSGVCCWMFNYRLKDVCKEALKENCADLKVQGGLPYCVRCNAGFEQKGGVFGRCSKSM